MKAFAKCKFRCASDLTYCDLRHFKISEHPGDFYYTSIIFPNISNITISHSLRVLSKCSEFTYPYTAKTESKSFIFLAKIIYHKTTFIILESTALRLGIAVCDKKIMQNKVTNEAPNAINISLVEFLIPVSPGNFA